MQECILVVLYSLIYHVSLNFGASFNRENSNRKQASQDNDPFGELTPLESRCLTQEKVPYETDCYELLLQGPCKADEWLLLDFESAVQSEPHFLGVCAEKQCNDKDIFWPQDGYCYNVTQWESSLCPEHGTYLHLDPFGEGTCDCKVDRPYLRWFESDNRRSFKCFEAYTEGPCAEGYIIMKQNKRVVCVKDPCYDLQGKNHRYVQVEDSGGCFRLGSQGPCPQNNKLIIHPERKVPSCDAFSEVHPLHLVSLPTICKTDHTGMCVDAIELTGKKDKFANQLIQIVNEKKRKAALN